MMQEPVIELRHVTFVYPDETKALSDVSIAIFRGERVGILGPNGAGKSTLVMHFNGLLEPTKGEVKAFGMPITRGNIYDVRKRIGLVFQNPDEQLFCLTVWEDVAFGPVNLGLTEDEVKQRVEEALKIVNLEAIKDKPPFRLSYGEKKRVAIASVLSMKPEVLILDEPTMSLDPRSRKGVLKFLAELHERKDLTLIIATCDIELVRESTDRVFLLNEGKIVAEGPTDTILSNRDLMKKAGLE
jgi:cobalt/nickel transport system ATP-binding protein